MSSYLLDALSVTENDPSGGYKTNIINRSLPVRRKTKKETVETISEPVEIIDDSSNSSSGSKASPVKNPPKSRSRRIKQNNSVINTAHIPESDLSVRVPTTSPSTSETSSASSPSPSRGRGRGHRGRRTGAGRGAAGTAALQAKKLRGTACGANLIGIQQVGGGGSVREDLEPHTGVYKGRQWLYTTPRRISVYSTPKENSVIVAPQGPQQPATPPGANGMSRTPLMASSDCDRFSTDQSMTDTSVSTSEKDECDTSFIFGVPVRGRRQVLKPNRTCSNEPINSTSTTRNSAAPMRSPIRKLTDYNSSEAEKREANKKLKSSHSTCTTENHRTQTHSNILRSGLILDSEPHNEKDTQHTNTRNAVRELSAESKQSLAALEPNLKGVTLVYTPTVKRNRSAVQSSGSSEKLTEVIEADSTIEVPSEDDTKGSKRGNASETGAADTSTDEINFISDTLNGGEEEPVHPSTIISIVCPNCGTSSTTLDVCGRCGTNFKKRKPTRYQIRGPTKGVKVCPKCGVVYRIRPPSSKPTPQGGSDFCEPLICKSCRHGGKVIEDKKDTSLGPGAAFQPKNFYLKKLHDFSSSTTTTAATKSATTATKRPTLSSRTRGLPNKRNKGRTKPEPECISLIDSDDEDTPEVATTTEVIPPISNFTPARSDNTRKSRMKNEVGEPVGTNVNGVLVTGSAETCLTVHNTNNSHPRPAADQSAPSMSSEQNLVSGAEWDEESLTLTLDLVLLAFGSKRFIDVPLRASISPAMIKFHFSKQVHGCGSVTLQLGEIVEFSYCLTQSLPSIFVKTVPAFALTVRSRMNMKKQGVHHFDPYSREIHETLLFFRPCDSSFNKDTASHLGKVIHIMRTKSSIPENFRGITISEVNLLLARHIPPKMLEKLQAQVSPTHPRVKSPPPCPKPPVSVCVDTPVTLETTSPPAVTTSRTPARSVVATVTVMAPSTTTPALMGLQPVQIVQCMNSPGGQRILIQSPRIVPGTVTSAPPAMNTYIILPQQLATQMQSIVATQTTPTMVKVTTASPGSTDSSIDSTTHRVRSPIPEPSQKILTYPPPPTMGGITVTAGDMGCLEEREFLNDVIIEFYLRYLLEERLSTHDRQRTHIFSSFFYKRLMQREYGSRSCDQNKELTPQEKRHLRVRKWTRRVDLFEKDFIIIPINESSHWYVALICFPSRVINTPSPAFLNQSDGSNQSEGSQSEEEPISVSGSEAIRKDGQDDTMDATEQNHTAENGPELESTDNQVTTDGVTATPSAEEAAGEGSDGGQGSGQGSTHGSESAINRDGQDCTTTPTPTVGDNDDAEYSLHHCINHEVPCIIIMDSLKSTTKRHVIQKLREYLEIEWRTRKNAIRRFTTRNMKGLEPRVPQQSNFSDCGIYILQYVEQFFKKPIRNFSPPLKGLSNWFPESEVKSKREAITQLILDLKAKQETRTHDT